MNRLLLTLVVLLVMLVGRHFDKDEPAPAVRRPPNLAQAKLLKPTWEKIMNEHYPTIRKRNWQRKDRHYFPEQSMMSWELPDDLWIDYYFDYEKLIKVDINKNDGHAYAPEFYFGK